MQLIQKGWRSRWSYLWVGFLLSLLLSTGLVSCHSPHQASGAADRAEVEFWTMQLQPQYTDYFNDLIQRFEQQHPTVKVRWVDVPWAAMQSKIIIAVAANTAPDVVNLNPSFAAQLAEKNVWLELDGKVPAEVQQQYLPNIWKASTLDGKTFGLPWYLTSRIAIYNQELLKQVGWDNPPATFTELFQLSQALKQKLGKMGFFSTLVPEDSGEVLESFVQRGVSLVDGSGKAAFNTAKGREIFQSWVDLYRNGWVPQEVLTEGHRYAIELYQRGDSAIVTSSPEFFKAIAKNAPAIAQVSAPAAQITGETGKKNVAVMNLVIPKQTDQPEAALQFALFVTNNENQLAFAKAANVLPSTQAALSDPYFSELPTDPTVLDRARLITAKQLQSAEVLIPAMREVKRLQKVIYENMQAAMMGKKTVETAIADAERAWNEDL